ncbi:cAMP-dependent protein kinase regulatory subunit [Diplonema papillatum]|nr:cAMP-dependent protein kinase regulatory subunit [Diplonema papillatum]
MGNCSSGEQAAKHRARVAADQPPPKATAKKQCLGPKRGGGANADRQPSSKKIATPSPPPPLSLELLTKHEKVAGKARPLDNLSQASPPGGVTHLPPVIWDEENDTLEVSLIKRAGDNRMLDVWKQEPWPWVWELVEPPDPKTSSSEDYTTFLQCFKILRGPELEAHRVWKNGLEDMAREILRSPPEGLLLSSPATSVLSPSEDGSSFCGLNDTLNSSVTSHSLAPPAGQYRKKADVLNAGSVDVSTYMVVPHAKTFDENMALVDAIRRCPLFAHLVREKEVSTVAAGMRRIIFRKNQEVLRRGYLPKPGGSGLYIITKGCVTVDERVLLGPGQYFGENLVTAPNTRARHNVVTSSVVEAFLLENEVYNGVMGRQANDKRIQYKEWLQNIPFLNGLSAVHLLQLADALEERKYEPNEVVIEFGKPGNFMHFIVEGEVDIWGRETLHGELMPDYKQYVCTFGPGHPVGYIEFFDELPVPSIADVVAKGVVVTARIDREHFERCMGNVKEFLQQLTEEPEYEYYRSMKATQQRQRPDSELTPRTPMLY